jgi:hypothetical protein
MVFWPWGPHGGISEPECLLPTIERVRVESSIKRWSMDARPEQDQPRVSATARDRLTHPRCMESPEELIQEHFVLERLRGTPVVAEQSGHVAARAQTADRRSRQSP